MFQFFIPISDESKIMFEIDDSPCLFLVSTESGWCGQVVTVSGKIEPGRTLLAGKSRRSSLVNKLQRPYDRTAILGQLVVVPQRYFCVQVSL